MEQRNEHHDLLMNPTRYTLRARQAKQLNPYAYDKIQYKQQLRSNPDAIVKIVSPKKGGHHGHQQSYDDEDAEMQNWGELDGYDADGVWEDRRIRREKGSRERRDEVTYADVIRYPEALQNLPSTDEEEEREVRALSKEARRMLREQRARKAREVREAGEMARNKKKARSFPISRRLMSPHRRVNHAKLLRTGNVSKH
jgi:hypothetical protein